MFQVGGTASLANTRFHHCLYSKEQRLEYPDGPLVRTLVSERVDEVLTHGPCYILGTLLSLFSAWTVFRLDGEPPSVGLSKGTPVLVANPRTYMPGWNVGFQKESPHFRKQALSYAISCL